MKLHLSHAHAGKGREPLPKLDPTVGTAESASTETERRMSSGALLVFLAGSFMAHGVAYAALAALPPNPGPGNDDVEIAFSIVQTPDEPAPVVAREPEPVPVVRPNPRRAAAAPKLPVATPTPPAAPEQAVTSIDPSPAPLTLGGSSEGGLAVAGVVGSSTFPGAANGKGTGTPAPVRTVDLRPIASAWTRKVEAAIKAQASRDYPRAALRARLEGSVLLAVRVDPKGHLASVEITRSSGHSQLDAAALAAARALGDLPAPPEALHGYLRPIQIPINYRL